MTYTIGQAATMLEVSSQSLRHWEKCGLTPKPHRTPTNHRRYLDEDIEAIKEFLKQKNQTTE